MNKTILTSIALAIFFFPFGQYQGSTTAVVTIVGAHIKAKDSPINQKYPRKKCPVCKGTGKYISGDGIKQVDCGYCDPNL